MKILVRRMERQEKAKVIARFGSAHLVRRIDGALELRDGTPCQKVEACEWISLFSHEALLHTGREIR
jgi:hypothetical protein